jgi:putative transposase
VRQVKLRDRGAGENGSERVRFTSALLSRWAKAPKVPGAIAPGMAPEGRRTRSLDAVLPIPYLRGVSMGDFQEALAALAGRDAPNLSPTAIARLCDAWQAEYARWRRRDLSARHHACVWARLAEGSVRRSRMEGQDEGDGVYLQARMEP